MATTTTTTSTTKPTTTVTTTTPLTTKPTTTMTTTTTSTTKPTTTILNTIQPINTQTTTTPPQTSPEIFTCPMEPVTQGPSPSFTYQYREKVKRCKSQMMIYTALLLVMIICTLTLAKFTLSLYHLLQCRKRTNHSVKLTHFSYTKEVVFRPLQEAETVGL
ncbi:hypothetical protein EYF80_020667 [Liparis tanakae]|uniref:Uncharacterized protein n=1 Tax=Liparis tanakae TaxID=230148 RepID=A0A4Z2HVP8_9TELE|nr:hypothetical protein EYF80_020667 [Liparis tanakae]